MISKRRKWSLMLAGGLVVIALVMFLSHDQEPQYQGRRLSYWIYLYTAAKYRWPHPEAPKAWARKDEARLAVRAIGPAAIPRLIRWIGYEPNQMETKCIAFMARFRKGPLTRWIPDGNAPDPKWLRAVAASDALTILGPEAASAAPDLVRLARRAKNPAGAQKIVEALASLGPEGVLALSEILTNAPPPSAPEADAHPRFDAIFQLTNMGTNALPAVPALAQCLADGDEQVAMQADLALRSIVVTVVSESLAGLGGRPRHMTPSLAALLNAKASQVREATTNAIREIAPEVLTQAAPR